MGKSNWKPEDHTDFDLIGDLVKRTCHGCASANKDMRGTIMNDCARCIETGWQVKKRFKAAKRSTASKNVPDKDLLAGFKERQGDMGTLIEHLQSRKVPELARLAKLLGLTIPFGSNRDTFVNTLVMEG